MSPATGVLGYFDNSFVTNAVTLLTCQLVIDVTAAFTTGPVISSGPTIVGLTSTIHALIMKVITLKTKIFNVTTLKLFLLN